MNVECSLISCYLVKRLKNESLLKNKALIAIACCIISTYVQVYVNIDSIQYL